MLKPSSYNSLAELIHALGMRSDTAKHIGISHNTLNVRMANPGTFTLNELVKVAELAKSDLLTMTRLAQKQMDNPVEPPAPALGRPRFKKNQPDVS